jgi:integrase
MSARPFSPSEYSILAAYLAAAGRTRDHLLLVLGSGSGYRVSELLTLRVRDVWRDGDVVHEVTIARRFLKGGHGVHRRSVRGRRVVLSEPVRAALREHLTVIGTGNLDLALFTSAKAKGEPMGRSMVFRILRAACSACGITNARVSTHSLRKTFVSRVFQASGNDLIATQRIVCHSSPITTARYLETDSTKLDELVRHLAA